MKTKYKQIHNKGRFLEIVNKKLGIAYHSLNRYFYLDKYPTQHKAYIEALLDIYLNEQTEMINRIEIKITEL